MTTIFGGQGFGGPPSTSRETQALSSINSRQKSFVNRDFVKNIAWLNNSVDTLSAYTQKLQKGVDEANQNTIEQIQAFASDLFVLFAGGEPTGIDIGDLKYVIQGIGALLGINPDTPFPMNLLEAAWHLFNTYIVPQQQFTDIIFDTVEAWAVDLGLSPEFIESVNELRTAIEQLGMTFDEFFNSIDQLFQAFGPDYSALAPLWDLLASIFAGFNTDPIRAILVSLVDLGIPFINALTALVNGANNILHPWSNISGSQITALGANISPPVNNQTTVWSVGSNINTAWIYDSTQSSGGDPGSFTTLGTGVAKRVQSQEIYGCKPGDILVCNASLRWSGIPNAANDFGIAIFFYTDANEIGVNYVNIGGGHGTTGGWSTMGATQVTVPQDINGFKIAGRVGTGITSGQVWVDAITVQKQGQINQSLIQNLVQDLQKFLTGTSPLNALNLFNQVPPNLMGLVPVSQIGDIATNLLENPGFDTADSIVLNPGWTWDGTDGRSNLGCAVTTADGTRKAIVSNVIGVAQNQTVAVGVWVKYLGLTAAPNQNAIRLSVEGYNGTALVSRDLVAFIASPTGNSVNAIQNNFVQITGNYPVPAGVDNIVLVPEVTPDATAGTVKFDDASASKSGLMSQSLVAGLPADMQARILELQNLQNAVAGKAGALIADVQNRLKNIKFDGSGLFDASKLFNVVPIAQVPTDQLNRGNIGDLGTILDHVTNALIGAGQQFSATDPGQARFSMDDIFNRVIDINKKMQDIRSGETAVNISGTSVTVNFGSVPDGPLPSNFTTTYSGTGSSTIGITDGKAGWRVQNNNGNRTAMVVYNTAPTKTDYQIVRGTLAGPPPGASSGGTPKIAAVGRVDNPANPREFIWARGFCTGTLTYKGEIGYNILVGGVSTEFIIASDIPLTWSMDIIAIFGANGNPRRIQVFSGTKLVKDIVESGTNSKIDVNHRYWGCRTQIMTGNNNANPSPFIAGTSVSDNQPPDVVGSTFRAHRANATTVTFSGTNKVPAGFFDSQDYISDDMTWDGTNLKVTLEGTYLINIRYMTPNIPGGGKADIALWQNNTGIRRLGGGFADSSFGANSGSGIFAMSLVYCKKNDVINFGYVVDANVTATGHPTDPCTFVEVSLVNYGVPLPVSPT